MSACASATLRPLVIPVMLGLGTSAVACLFPSFDGLRGDRGPSPSRGGDDDDSATDAGDARTTEPIVDGGRNIECSDACAPPRFCCTTVGGPTCQDRGTEVFCTSVEGGRIFRCDGPDDCRAGELCCFDGTEAHCAVDCLSGQALCGGPVGTCPEGTSCSAVIESIYRACK